MMQTIYNSQAPELSLCVNMQHMFTSYYNAMHKFRLQSSSPLKTILIIFLHHYLIHSVMLHFSPLKWFKIYNQCSGLSNP